MPMKKFKLWSWIVCGFLLLFLGATFVFHQFSLRNESKLLTPIGKQVTVNGHRMNVSVKGEGPETIVFLSGAGIASPILDFKNLSDSLSQKYKVVVVERAGYGFSEDSDRSRDVMEVLSETRQALAQAHISGPYVIVSHSMASLESLAWQEKYPNEVKALIGLDWALPASYEDLKEHPTLITLAYWTSKIGLLRYFPESVYLKNSDLTKRERQQYRFLAYKQLLSTAMLNETRTVKKNAQKVSKFTINPKIPVLLLVSNGEGTSFSQSKWQNYAKDFSRNQSNIQSVYIDAPHELYHYQSDAIVSPIKEFLENN
ncbi:alpha/beta hydrolase [Streptococcus parasanguinis]|uniref:alpha/beta hydrolase n=1 Tax=Streptococcus parasanguinis TaxID=1318 RepID=UPI0039C2004F